MEQIEEVLRHLESAEITINLDKYVLGAKSCDFMATEWLKTEFAPPREEGTCHP